MITLIDYGAGNLASLEGALGRLGFASRRAAAPAEDAGGLLLLPGVGHFGAAKRALQASGWWAALPDRAASRPVLGICLGLQLLAEASDEAGEEGLGLLRGTARKLGPGVKVPHMGWSRVKGAAAHPATAGAEGAWLYFIHSYALETGPDTLLTADHGRAFTAMAGRGRVLGFQPHPEKSGSGGLRLLKQTLRWMSGDRP
ncbi:MAG TPA: imidazole glycerol phosphate synthase subunit HisH [Holophagaceae bacterium]|nr:imidazole glycerol phosphate synthase subunit HisH [Holophagaceae bacterium]